METKYTLIRADGTTEDFTADWPKRPGYDLLKATVRPLIASLAASGPDSYEEHLTVLQDGERRDMFVDENGRLKNLPRNEAATTIYRHNWLTQHPTTDPETLPVILGDAVLFHRRVWF